MPDQRLTIRHDSGGSARPYVDGALLAIRKVSGLVGVQVSGRQKHYQANPDSPIFHELVSLVRKTAGLHEPVRDALEPWADRIRTAFIYGSAASGDDRADSDIDVLVVSDELDYPTMLGALQKAEDELGRKLSPRLMRTSEWDAARREPGSFAARISERPQVYVIGGGDAT
jgi:predicted nucleotidyltransferase